MAIFVAMVGVGSVVITPEMLSLIAEIDEFKGAWRALGRLTPERLGRLRRVATIESTGSSTRIEGAKLTDLEVEALLSRAASRLLATRDEQEVVGYAEVMDLILSTHEAIPVSESHIKQLHSMLLRHVEKDARHRGEYKKIGNQIEAFDASGASLGVIPRTTSPFDTPREMRELVDWFTQEYEAGSLHPLIVTGVFVVVFLAIHPFQDGNGRLSRALTTLILLKYGYAFVPYASLERIIEQTKDGYYLALRRTQGTLRNDSPDWTPWLTYFVRSLREHKKRLETKIEKEHVMREALSELAVTILELAADHGEVSVSGIMRVTGAPRGTVKKRLTELLAAGQLKQVGVGRATRYVRA